MDNNNTNMLLGLLTGAVILFLLFEILFKAILFDSVPPDVKYISDLTNSDAFKQKYRDNAAKYYDSEFQKLVHRL